MSPWGYESSLENLVLITRVALPVGGGGMKFPANLVLITCVAHVLCTFCVIKLYPTYNPRVMDFLVRSHVSPMSYVWNLL